jgi:hypothetical protein
VVAPGIVVIDELGEAYSQLTRQVVILEQDPQAVRAPRRDADIFSMQISFLLVRQRKKKAPESVG